ncbi:MAG: hypothetical protein Tsb0021_09090 [Chlamydiales bacterium]
MGSKTISLGLSLGTHPLVGIGVLPLLDLLKEQDAIQLKKIVGSGQGALSSALVARNDSPERIKEVLITFYRESFYEKFNFNIATAMFQVGPQTYHPSQSLFSGDRKRIFFAELFGKEKIEEQKIPLKLVATDLYTAEPILIDSGYVAEGVYGASAWFPFHPPIRYKGRLLVSGGFSDSIPTINDPSLDLEIVVTIVDPDTWKSSFQMTHGWAFFERAFQSLESPHKTMIRHKEGRNIIPLTVTLDRPIPYEAISEKDINYVLSKSEEVIQNTISSQLKKNITSKDK